MLIDLIQTTVAHVSSYLFAIFFFIFLTLIPSAIWFAAQWLALNLFGLFGRLVGAFGVFGTWLALVYLLWILFRSLFEGFLSIAESGKDDPSGFMSFVLVGGILLTVVPAAVLNLISAILLVRRTYRKQQEPHVPARQ